MQRVSLTRACQRPLVFQGDAPGVAEVGVVPLLGIPPFQFCLLLAPRWELRQGLGLDSSSMVRMTEAWVLEGVTLPPLSV